MSLRFIIIVGWSIFQNTPANSLLIEQDHHILTDIDVKTRAEQLLKQGIQYFKDGKYDIAINIYKQVLIIRHQLNDKKGIGYTNSLIGKAYYKSSKYNDAISFYQEAIKIFSELGENKLQANQLNNLGIAYESIGRYSDALSSYQKSIILFKQLNDLPELGKTLDNMSFTYYNLGKYADAINQYHIALEIRRTLGDKRGEGITLQGIGNIHIELGQYAKSLEFYQQALESLQGINEPKLQGFVLSSIGFSYVQQGLYNKALEFYEKALSLYKKSGSRLEEGHTLNRIGDVYLFLKDDAKGFEALNQSLMIAREINDRQYEGRNLNSLGNFYKFKKDFAKSHDSYQQALVISREISDRTGERITLSSIGDLLAQRKPELAIIFYKQAVNVTQSIRQDLEVLSREQQESYTQTVADTYRRLADLLLSQGRVLEAQQVLELLKIQELRDYTRDTRAGGETQGSPLTPVESRVVPPYTNLVNLGLKLTECERKPPYCSEREQLRSLRDQANAEFNKEADKLRALAKQQSQRDPAQIQQEELTVAAQKVVQSQPKTVLIYPLVLEDKLWLVWGTQAGKQGVVFNNKVVPVGRKELATIVVEFRQLLEQPGDVKELQKVSQKLYQWLIAPLRTELDANNIQNLVFSLDRSTRYIPMAALFDGKKYLVESFNTSTILTSGLTNTNERLSPKIEDDPVLGLGLSDAVPNFNPLPNVKDEINAIIRTASNPNGIYPGLSRLNKDFSKDAFKDLIDYRILHIATHGKFISSNPEDSFLLLGNGNKFNITEIKNLTDLGGIHLVVLSACETARGGEDKEGIEVSGISYYFLTSGAKSVVASLWLVNDASTSQLMRLFYENLSTGKMTKTAALRQAQLTMIVGKTEGSDTNRSSVNYTPWQIGNSASISRNLSHPYYWSPFILIGNGL